MAGETCGSHIWDDTYGSCSFVPQLPFLRPEKPESENNLKQPRKEKTFPRCLGPQPSAHPCRNTPNRICNFTKKKTVGSQNTNKTRYGQTGRNDPWFHSNHLNAALLSEQLVMCRLRKYLYININILRVGGFIRHGVCATRSHSLALLL